MKISVIGLGLIGASIAKSIKANTNHQLLGFDIDSVTVSKAVEDNSIDAPATEEDFSNSDLLIIALYPKATREFIEAYSHKFGKNKLVIDICGVKESVMELAKAKAEQYGFRYVGTHPMAGIERSGYDFAKADLFQNASMLICPCANTTQDIEMLTELFLQMGFGQVKHTNAKQHDRVIACTSQLAHIVSSAYVKSETAREQSGFSAGSFKDMTRVARLNPQMWAQLFFENNENLTLEIDELIKRLALYSDALKENDFDKMIDLLAEGNDIKIMLSEQ